MQDVSPLFPLVHSVHRRLKMEMAGGRGRAGGRSACSLLFFFIVVLAGIRTVRTTGIAMRAAVVLAFCCRWLFSVQDAREREREGEVTKL